MGEYSRVLVAPKFPIPSHPRAGEVGGGINGRGHLGGKAHMGALSWGGGNGCLGIVGYRTGIGNGGMWGTGMN